MSEKSAVGISEEGRVGKEITVPNANGNWNVNGNLNVSICNALLCQLIVSNPGHIVHRRRLHSEDKYLEIVPGLFRPVAASIAILSTWRCLPYLPNRIRSLSDMLKKVACGQCLSILSTIFFSRHRPHRTHHRPR